MRIESEINLPGALKTAQARPLQLCAIAPLSGDAIAPLDLAIYAVQHRLAVGVALAFVATAHPWLRPSLQEQSPRRQEWPSPVCLHGVS